MALAEIAFAANCRTPLTERAPMGQSLRSLLLFWGCSRGSFFHLMKLGDSSRVTARMRFRYSLAAVPLLGLVILAPGSSAQSNLGPSNSAQLNVAQPNLVPPNLAKDAVWRSVGPPGGNVISLALSPAGTVYLGAADGHIFASADAGQHWSLCGRVTVRHDAVVQKLIVDAQNENQLFAAVWFQDVREGGGLFRSIDAGATWAPAGLSGEVVRAVEQSPSAAEVFVAGTRSGVFRSTDAAQSWQRISPAGDPELRNVDSVAIDPRNPETIYAGTYHLPWKTIDAGKTWSPVAAGMIDDSDVMSLRADSTIPGRIFASACSGIYRSENSGAAWTKLQGIPYSSRRTQAIVQDPRDPRIIYAATTEGLWVTPDGGESWTRTTPRDWVVNDVVVWPAKSSLAGAAQEILLATEQQGILLSRDGGQTFASANQGFSHRVTGALVGDLRDANHFLAWMPDSPDALIESHDGGATWTPLPGSTPQNAPPSDISRIFSTDAGWWAATSSGVLHFYDAAAGKWSAFKFVAPVPRTVRTGRAARSAAPVLQRAVPRPNTAAVLSNTSDITAVRVIGARVLVATSQSLWSGVWSGALSSKILRPVKVFPSAPGDSATGAASLWMIAAGQVLRSADDGKTWQAETLDISPSLPDAAIRWIREIPVPTADAKNASAAPRSWLLAGTSQGLYRRTPSDGSWQLVQNGIPAGEPISCFFGGGLSLVALRGGGLYLSRDASQTWERLDAGPRAGQFTGSALNARGELVVASLTEGLFEVGTSH
jgi:photosystem II stability/assembly factor-like uncharacterized protein